MNVTEFRVNLMRQYAAHERQAEKYVRLVTAIPRGAEDTSESEVLRAAWLGHSMAATYSYAIAGILRVIEDAGGGGAEMAEHVAAQARMIIHDGDFANMNADIAEPPGAERPEGAGS